MTSIPANLPESSIESSIVFDRAAHFYDTTRGFPSGEEKHVAALLSRVGNFTAQSRIIEIGVGTGRIALPLAQRVGMVYGVDLSRQMLNRLREKQQGEPVRIVEGDITRLPLRSGTFDGAVAVHILHLVPGWRVALREVARVLKPGALFLVGHGESVGQNPIRLLDEASNAAMPADYPVDVGMRPEKDAGLISEGWTQVGEMQRHEYSFYERPQGYLEKLQKRTWSRTWRLTDEQLATCVDAVQKTMAEHFADPNEPIEIKSSFEVRAYRAP